MVTDLDEEDISQKFFYLENFFNNSGTGQRDPASFDYINPTIEGYDESLDRYSNVAPYEKFRYVLKRSPDKPKGYINASNIQLGRSYIATQGPTRWSVAHFWEMALQERSKCIIMLTPLSDGIKEKCYKYWPDKGETIEVSNEAVRYFIETVKEEQRLYTKRLINIYDEHHSLLHSLIQIQFENWQDHSSMENVKDLMVLFNIVDDFYDGKPIIVHCSAGCGRTGTFIAGLELRDQSLKVSKPFLYRAATSENATDDPILNLVFELRMRRCFMIQTFGQYRMLYELCKFLDYGTKQLVDQIPQETDM